jgi:hypothetical protein
VVDVVDVQRRYRKIEVYDEGSTMMKRGQSKREAANFNRKGESIRKFLDGI